MDIPKKYFGDRMVLLLITINGFLTVVTTILILLRLDTGRSDGYFVQYRSNLGLNAYTVGNAGALLSFVVFAWLVLGFHTYLSIRTYRMRRHIALVSLAFGTLLLALTIIISNALLVLR
ncbi:MAG: hypothetical protein ABI221_03240 [Candidatus Saccharimonadales bacterium]